MSKVTIVKMEAESPAETLTMMAVGDALTVMLKGAGTADYRWWVGFKTRDVDAPENTAMSLLASELGQPGPDGMFGIDELGRAAIWYEDVTFAHAVRDLVENI